MLQSHLQCRFDCLGSVTAIDDVLEAVAGYSQQQVSQRFERGTREKISVAVSHRIQLACDRRIDLGICVAEAEYGRSPRTVEVALAAIVVKIGPLAPGDSRQIMNTKIAVYASRHVPQSSLALL